MEWNNLMGNIYTDENGMLHLHSIAIDNVSFGDVMVPLCGGEDSPNDRNDLPNIPGAIYFRRIDDVYISYYVYSAQDECWMLVTLEEESRPS